MRRIISVVLAVAVSSSVFVAISSGQATAQSPLSVRASGTNLVDQNGQPVRLAGVNRSGTEYACRQNWGVFVGPVDNSTINAMKSWNVNTVRIPLNEHCWLGTFDNPYTGANYRSAVTDYVNRLNAAGIYAILDLHFTEAYGPYSMGDPQRQPMANANYSIDFWTSVAETYGSNRAVMFELFNEPHGISWQCWRDGCWYSEGNIQTAGMQQMVDAVRDTGAQNPIILNGLDWGHDMSRMLEFLPDDPAGQLVAGQHLYNFKKCVSEQCWNTQFKPVANRMPMVGAEIGQEYCWLTDVHRFMDWMDANGGDGYVPWAWEARDCNAPGSNQFGGSPLLRDWNGTPTQGYGEGVKSRFLAPTQPPTTTSTTAPPPTSTSTSTSTTSTTRAPTTTSTTRAPTTTTTRPPTTTTTTAPPPTTTTTTRAPTTTSTTSTTAPPPTPRRSGYRVVTADGEVHGFGGAAELGNAPAGIDIAGSASTPDGRGYWLVSKAGGVYAYGTAAHLGDMAGKGLNQPITGMAARPDGLGYWLLGADGGVFSFGTAKFFGSTGSIKLNAPVVSMAAQPDGNGYWFVASDGGVFSYGSARFAGSTGSIRLNQPVVGMAPFGNGSGYWLVASDGGIFAYGAPFHGSTGSIRLNQPVVGMLASRDGDGYRLVARDGGVFAFGNAPFEGSLVDEGSTSPVVAISS